VEASKKVSTTDQAQRGEGGTMVQKKVCKIGSYGVGKTSLVRRFVENIFSEQYQSTVGVHITRKLVDVAGQTVMLLLWDLAGEDELAQLRVEHLRGASGYLIVADGLRASTLTKAVELQERISEGLGELPFLLVMNKVDCVEEWEPATKSMEELRSKGWVAVRTSAKTGEGVEAMFRQLTARMMAA